MEGIVVSRIRSSSPKYSEVWKLREEVLRIPIGLSLKNENLSQDHDDDIFIAEQDGKIIGCLMVHPIDRRQVKFRQMAVYSEWQGKGVGRLLVNAAEQFCREKGYQTIVLHARIVAVAFYKKLGYTASGDEFTEVGIPHFMMEKDICK